MIVSDSRSVSTVRPRRTDSIHLVFRPLFCAPMLDNIPSKVSEAVEEMVRFVSAILRAYTVSNISDVVIFK